MSKPDLLRRPVVRESSQEAKEVVSGLLGGVTKRELKQIPLTSIRTAPQVRREFPVDAHRALVENVRLQGGVIEPVIVNLSAGDSKYLIVAGERRLRAVQELQEEYEAAGDVESAEKYSFVPALIYQDLTFEQIREMQLSENLLREDLTDLEEALALADLLAVRLGVEASEVPSVLERLEKEARGARQKREGHDEQLRVVEETFAAFSSITWRTFVKRRLHLFRLPEDVLAAVRAGRITSLQAEILGRLRDNTKSPEALKAMREDLMKRLERGMSLEELSSAVKAAVNRPDSVQRPEVQVALRVKRSLTPKRLMALPSKSRRRVQELLEEVYRLMDGEARVEGE